MRPAGEPMLRSWRCRRGGSRRACRSCSTSRPRVWCRRQAGLAPLFDALSEFVAAGGKRLRPLFCYWGAAGAGADPTTRASCGGGGPRAAAPVRPDPGRRDGPLGVAPRPPTLHVVAAERHREHAGLGDAALFGDSVATLVADLALERGDMLVAGTAPEVRARLAAERSSCRWASARRHRHRGRRRDLPTSRRIARLKCGRYTITRPLQLGALVAGADAGSCAGSSRGATWSATPSSCATTCSASGATPRAPASPRATTCARASPRTARLGRAAGRRRPRPPAARPPAAPAPSTTPGSPRCSRRWSSAGARERAECAVADLVAERTDALDDLRRRPRGRRRAARPRRRRRLAVRVTVSSSSGPGSPAWPPRATSPPRATTSRCSNARPVGGRAGALHLGDFRIDTGPRS